MVICFICFGDMNFIHLYIVKHKLKKMGRTNKMTEGVFTDIVGTDSEISSYDRFIRTGGETKSLLINEFVHEYTDLIEKNRSVFLKLAELEQIIMQLRSTTNMDDIKLSIVREYIYARCSFFRRDKTAKDIRVIVDNVEFWTDDVNQLLSNTNFMEKAKTKLVKAMQKEVTENILGFREKHNTVEVSN